MSEKLQVHRIAELDGIRGFAVLVVVMLHFHAPFADSRPLGWLSPIILHTGGTGVDIFFVLSGFLITSILIATKDTENYFSAFYARRALRIFPLYLVTVAFFFWALLPLEHRHGLSLGFRESEQVWYWTFLGNWRQGLGYNDGAGMAHYWSLAIEEQFYIGFSLLVLWLSNKWLVRACYAMIVLSVALRLGLAYAGHFDIMMTRLTVLRLDPIAMGALLAASARVRALAARWWLALLAIGVAGVYLQPVAGLSVTGVGLAASGMVALGATQPVRWLRWSVLRSLGKYSYAMYVLHGFLSAEAAHLAKTNQTFGLMLASLVGGTLASYLLAWVSWHVFEKWFLRWKDRFPYRSAHPEEQDVDRRLITV